MYVCHVERLLLHQPALSPLSEQERHFIILLTINFQHQSNDEDCQDYNNQLRSANIYCFRAELSAKGAKQGVETPPEVFPPDDLPRPSRPKAGLGLVMMMMMVVTLFMMMVMLNITMPWMVHDWWWGAGWRWVVGTQPLNPMSS